MSLAAERDQLLDPEAQIRDRSHLPLLSIDDRAKRELTIILQHV